VALAALLLALPQPCLSTAARQEEQQRRQLQQDGKGTEQMVDYSKLLANTFLFLEVQQSGQLPSWNRAARSAGGFRGTAHVTDGAAVGVDLTGGWYIGAGAQGEGGAGGGRGQARARCRRRCRRRRCRRRCHCRRRRRCPTPPTPQRPLEPPPPPTPTPPGRLEQQRSARRGPRPAAVQNAQALTSPLSAPQVT
jgi:hypothetical protein